MGSLCTCVYKFTHTVMNYDYLFFTKHYNKVSNKFVSPNKSETT